MPDDAPQREVPTGGTVIVWIFLLAVAALLVMVIYTFAATDDGPSLRNNRLSAMSTPRGGVLTQASSDDHPFLTER
jgi:hypothetical protein